MSHTPGPWTVGPWQKIEHHLIPPAHGYPINGEFGHVGFVIGSEEEARLIAAAPDLLAALEGVLDRVDGWLPKPPEGVVFDGARAAIAKAKGEA